VEIKNYPWIPSPLGNSQNVKMGEGVNKDRDPNQNPFNERPMTDEEFAEALKKLGNIKGFREAKLTYKVEKTSDSRR